MEIWQLLNIVKYKKTLFFKEINTSERIDALIEIKTRATPTYISHIFPFILDSNKEIRYISLEIILNLFNQTISKKDIYQTARNCEIKLNDLNKAEVLFNEQDFTSILTIASLNYNGYIREYALTKLTEIQNPETLPYFIFRLADWVENVRITAHNSFKTFLKPENSKYIVENLNQFYWLQQVERVDLKPIYNEVIHFLTIENRKYILENLNQFNEKSVRIIAKEFIQIADITYQELSYFINHKSLIVRHISLKRFELFDHNQIQKFLNEKAAKIRYETLYLLKDSPGFEKIIEQYIVDESALIRNFARFTLRNKNINFIEIYHQNLIKKENIIGSICGLAELNAKEYESLINDYLYSKNVKIKKIAFLALQKLESKSAFEFALENLNTELIGLRNLIVDYLENYPTNEVIENAREVFINNGKDLKVSMLKLFSKIGNYDTINDLMFGLIDENENVRNIAQNYIMKWKTKMNKYYSVPTNYQIEKAKESLLYVDSVLKERKYFNENPTENLTMYFK